MRTKHSKSKKTAYIHTRIDPRLKDEGLYVLQELGLSVSDFITMSFSQMAKDKAVQFELKLLVDDKPEQYTKVEDANHLKNLISFKEDA